MNFLFSPGDAAWRSLLFYLFCSLSLSSCAILGPDSALQPKVNSLLLADRLDLAADTIAAPKANYGRGNDLLYYLDRGLVEFYAGRHQESVVSFEKARQRFAELYTQSLSKEVLSWAVNDYMLPYRGADHEYVLVNIFQSLNYLAMGDLNEALVEARDLDAKYQVVDTLAQKVKRGHFEDNGFARLFMGLLFDATGRRMDRNDALLWYKQAQGLYDAYYETKYFPRVLSENLLTRAQEFSDAQFPRFQELWQGIRPVSQALEQGQAQIIVFQMVGWAPIKVSENLPVPLDKDFITQLAFPVFHKRAYDVRSGEIIVDVAGVRVQAGTELGVDIEDLAIRDLQSRVALMASKAALRPAMKYLLERKQKENIEKSSGSLAADLFGLVSNLYNIVSEQADLRSWQSLPAQIRVARLFVPPGRAHIVLQEQGEGGAALGTVDLGSLDLKAGETRFLTVRSAH